MTTNRFVSLKTLVSFVAVVAIGMASAGVALAGCMTARHDGTLLGAGGAIVTMQEKPTGTERSFRVSEHASVRRDGKTATLVDLKPGDTVKIVTETDARKIFATVIDARTSTLQNAAE